MQDPFDLNPSQDMMNPDKYRLIRDNPGTPSSVGNTQGTVSGGLLGMPGMGYGGGGAPGRAMNPYDNPAYGQMNNGMGYGNGMGNRQINNGMGYGQMNNGMGNRPNTPNGGQMNTSGIYLTLQEMEGLRKSINSRYIFLVIALIAPIFLSLIFARSVLALRGMVLFMMVLVPVVALIVLMPGIRKKKDRLKALYKETFVKQLLMEHFQDVFYDWKRGFDEMWVRHTGLVRMGNRYHSEDYLCALWRGVRFEQADVTVQYHNNSGRNSYTVTYFQGRMFSFDYTRKQTMPVMVHSKDFRYAGTPDNRLKLDKVEMEDVEFNKEFAVKAMNPHDAFYILTPAMMQRLKYLHQMYGRVTMVIVQQKLYIGLDNRVDAFDAQTTRAIEYPRERERMLRDVKVIEALIEILNCLP